MATGVGGLVRGRRAGGGAGATVAVWGLPLPPIRRALNTSAKQTVFLWALFGLPIVLAIYSLARGEIVPAIGGVLLAALVFPGAVINSFARRRGWSPHRARQLEIKLMTAGTLGLAGTGIVAVKVLAEAGHLVPLASLGSDSE